MMRRVSFAALVAAGEPALEPLLLSLAADLGEAAGGGAEQRMRNDRAPHLLEEFGEPLDAAGGLHPVEQLELVSERVADLFTITLDGAHRSNVDDLRPDVVLEARAGHQVVVASLIAAIAQRQGLPLGVVLSGEHALVAHHGLDAPWVISVRHDGRLLDASDLDDPELAWRCPHEVSGAILGLVAARAEHIGLRPALVRARELIATLPMDERTSMRHQIELARARAVWN